MKCQLLSLHPLNQFLYPIKHRLVGGVGRYAFVMLDLAVEFGALLTHCTHRCRAVTICRSVREYVLPGSLFQSRRVPVNAQGVLLRP